MSYSIRVSLGRLVCRDRESTTAPHDIFALGGGVVVDGQRYGFACLPVAVNERQTWDYRQLVFSGFSEQPSIGLELVGFDIDDNEKWVANSAQVRDLAEKIGMFAGKVPVVGEAAEIILEVAPDVVDQFVAWDKNDLLLNWSDTIPMTTGMPYEPLNQAIEVKFNGSDPIGYSNWDYSLFVNISCVYVLDEGWEPEKTKIRPWLNSKPADWVGMWDGARVRAHIAPSKVGDGRLDVSITELSAGGQQVVESIGVPISRVFMQSVVSDVGNRRTSATKPTGERTKKKSGTVAAEWNPTNIVVERSSGKSSFVIELAPGKIGDPSPVVAGRKLGKPELLDDLEDRLPQRRQSGPDLLELSNGAIVELYQVLHGGKVVGDAQLRYVRPVATLLWRHGDVFDEVLHSRTV